MHEILLDALYTNQLSKSFLELTLLALLPLKVNSFFFFLSFFFLNFILFIFLYSRFLFAIYFIHISVYMSIPISQFIPPSPTPRHFPPWCPYVCSLLLCLYFCPANWFICTIFLGSTYSKSTLNALA